MRAAVVVAVAVAAGVFVLARGLGSGQSAGPGTGASPAGLARTPASPATSAFSPGATLAASANRDPVRVHFKHPPRAGILVDLDTGRILWRRDPLRVLPIASLAKMMTALVVVRSAAFDDQVPITREALAYKGSGVGVLPKGKEVRLETLLTGLLLPSGNDAAIALAQHVSGTTAAFIARMNRTAARLGLGCTHFTSVDGFDDANRSCAADLAKLARIDLAQPRIARITRLRSAVLPLPTKTGKVYLVNNNPLVRRGYPGITGLKTGETVAAGLCLVATAERNGRRLASVVLHAPMPPASLAIQSRALLDRGFAAR